MQVSSTSRADLVLLVASAAADLLRTPLPPPDLVSIYADSLAAVTLQFSVTGAGEARFGYVRQWADWYGVEVTRKGIYHEAEWVYEGVKFTAWAAESESPQ